MRANLAIVIIGILAAVAPESVACCSGVNDPPTEIASSAEIFEARVIATDHRAWARPMWIVEEKLGTTMDPLFGRLYNPSITVVVERAWKGSPSRTKTMVVPPGWSFSKGDRCLFYTTAEHRRWSDIGVCSRTRPMKYASEDLAVLGPPLKTYNGRSFWEPGLGAIAGCILFFALSAIAVMKKGVRRSC